MALRTNEDRKRKQTLDPSAFAKLALSRIGGSCVYIEPKKTRGKLLDTDGV